VFSTMLGAGLLVASALLVRGGAGKAEAVSSPGMDSLFPSFPGTEMLSMGDQGAVNGMPWRMAYFTARATPEQVVRFYEGFWKSKHLLVDGQGNGDGAHLAALDGTDGTMRSVTVRREGDRVMAFCGIGQPEGDASSAATDLPSFDEGVFQDNMVLDGASTETVLMPGSLAAGRAKVVERFQAKGWTPLDAQTRETKHGVMLQFQKSGRLAMAALARVRDDDAVAVQIHAATAGVAQGGALP